MSGLDVVVINGMELPLGRTLPEPHHLQMRASMMSFSAYLEANKIKMLPRSLWKPVNNRLIFPRKFLRNQLRYGACVGASCAMAAMKQRVLRGQPFVALSWGYIYDQINGGRDNGACITSALDVMLNKGAPQEDEYPIPVFNTRKQPASAVRFKLAEGLTLTNFDEMATAVQMGFMIQYPIQVGKHYTPDGNFICGYDDGPGNHSVHSDGLQFIPSVNEWCLDHMASWDPWGDAEGRAWHREKHIKGCAVDQDAFCHIDSNEDTQDDEALPDLN